MEADFHRHLPDHCTLHTARMYLESTTATGEEEMLEEHLPRAVRDLATAKPDACVFGCTSAGALRGNAHESELIERVSSELECPVASVAAAVRAEIQRIGAKSVTVITPYIGELNALVRDSLETAGITVACIHGLGIIDNFAIASVGPEELVRVARRYYRRHRSDALFISCTNLRALETVEELEDELDVPVITSNGAALRAVLTIVDDLRRRHEENRGTLRRYESAHRPL
jgi:maleate isomerase